MFGFGQRRIADVLPATTREARRRRANILVVDDDPNAFPLEALKDEGFKIEYWGEMKSLNRVAREFDIVVLDIGGVGGDGKYAESDGTHFLTHLREANADLKIIAFSGQTFDVEKTRFFELADEYLSKPADTQRCQFLLDQMISDCFDPKRVWDRVRSDLQAAGVKEKQIRRLENDIARSVKDGSTLDAAEKVRAIVDGSVDVVKIAAGIATILRLCAPTP